RRACGAGPGARRGTRAPRGPSARGGSGPPGRPAVRSTDRAGSGRMRSRRRTASPPERAAAPAAPHPLPTRAFPPVPAPRTWAIVAADMRALGLVASWGLVTLVSTGAVAAGRDERPLRVAIAGLVHGHVEGFLR